MSRSWRHEDSDYIQVVRENQPTGTRDIAEELGVAMQSASYRLKKLEEAGKVSSQKIGGSLIWSIDE